MDTWGDDPSSQAIQAQINDSQAFQAKATKQGNQKTPWSAYTMQAK